MKPWEKLALLGVVIVAVAHLVRDIMQSYGISTFFTEFLHKDVGSEWQSITLELGLLLLVGISYNKKKFVPLGLAASIILTLSLTAWGFIYVFV